MNYSANTEKVNFDPLREKIENLKWEIEFDTTTIEESKAAHEKFSKLVAERNIEAITEDIWSKIKKVSNIELLKSFEATLEMDLIKVPTRYIMFEAGQRLVSPAGFSPNSKVYIRPEGTVIFTDRLPASSDLVYCDLQKESK